MRHTRVLGDYVSNPAGKCFIGRSFLHFFDGETSCGTVFFDRPEEDGIRMFVQAVQAELPENSRPHTSFCDTRRLTAVDEAAFLALVTGLEPLHDRLGENVTRQAVVRPEGVLGAMVGGFYQVARAAHPERLHIFDDATQALTWLHHPDGAGLLAALDAARADATSTAPLLQTLREWVQDRPRASIGEAARALGVSPRVLQDRLRAEGTTFRDEINQARIRTAKHLLEHTGTKLESIARDVGCASLPHFSALFRRATGEPPGAWRARRRGPTSDCAEFSSRRSK